ncbi:uncharacterized protein LOC111356052 [Spodoptera litura]|uniref:Uncharacterized protein LOC111356052 n=1 Tax=Spodoptera litura TaxID=69820 RepID=A0A9J7ISV8_SPOLT|nr:uncharacterized protein LOC111356052 [Spodoptera litura]XP_022826031.1 uncharacterized protein LOC111356052 [Spodoptera litura]
MNKDINRRKVTSLGNSWIICKSKSHPGHVYYFNSLTGQAAWNLSDAEIEKARQTTKRLEQLPGAELACPEPKDKPPSPSPNAEPIQPALKKRIPPFENPQLNIIPEQPSSLLANLNVPLNQMTSILQGTQIANASSLGPICNMNLLNNPTHTFNLSNPTPMYNPKVWAVPQAQQIFIPTPIAPIVNQGPNSLNGAYNKLVESSTGIILDNLNNASASSIQVGSYAFNTRDLKFRKGFQQPINKKHGFTNKKDLRQMLSFKNRFQRKPGGSGVYVNGNQLGNHPNDFQSRIGNKDSKGTEQILEDSSKIDITPMKNLASPDCNSDAWFIVMDLEVLLNEFKFLNTVTDSDEICHLMVPKRVMEELKIYVTCTENVQARRILRFLSQQIEIGYAFMAEYPCGAESLSMTEVIEATCAELVKKKYHFILLTNDNELITRNSLVNIHMFTISEVRNLLGIQPKKQQIVTPNVVPKPKLSVNELLNKIKITVPNNFSPNRDTTSPDADIKYDEIIDEVPEIASKQKDNTEKPVSLKHTVDAGIQTDLKYNESKSSVSKELEEFPGVSKNIEIRKEAVTRPPETSTVVNVSKKRGIKLKRSVSSQPPVNSEENRQFKYKWRRRRNTTSQLNKQIPTDSNEITSSKELETCFSSNDNPKEHYEPSTDDPVSESTDNKVVNDSIESRESSIIAHPRNSVSQENVTIDETSTSGIISNTESSVDDNFTTSSNQVFHRKNNDKMYRVDSTTMEQYLKVKCDEWISRFVQIMEEVLTQVLHQDPPFSNSKLPPPWTLHEAALCIAMKFSDYKDIKEAANKLSNMIFCVSDVKGNIALNMTASQYMQMYSYGMHLLGALMEATYNIEDIKIAVESLNSLLHDIKNPCVDHSVNDSFNDNVHETSSNNNAMLHSDLPSNNDGVSEHDHEMSIDDNDNIAEVNKKSPMKRKLVEEETPKQVKFIRNININPSLFKHLTFQKSSTSNNGLIDKSNLQSEEKTNSYKVAERDTPLNTVETATNTTEKENNAPTSQPSIIRKFTAFPELEKKLHISNLYENHDEELDYDEDEEYLTEEYCSEDENNGELHDESFSNNIEDTDSLRPNERTALEEIEPCLINENNEKFKYAMYMFIQEIKGALSQVQILCDRCYKVLENPDASTELRLQLRAKAESARLHITRLSKSLESMLDHETSNSNRSMSKLLVQADVNFAEVDTELLSKYRISITKCKECADGFLKSAQDIISRLTCV